MSGKSRAAGITLLEMLISVAILAMVMSAISFSIFQTGNFRDKTSELIEIRQRSRVVVNLIRDDLKSAVFMINHTRRFGGAESGVIGIESKNAETDINQIYLHVHRPSKLIRQFDQLADPEVHEVAYFLTPNRDDDFYTLHRSEKFYINPKFERVSVENAEEILKNHLIRKNILLSPKVVSFKIEYLDGKNPKNGRDNWIGAWNSNAGSRAKGRVPEAVKVILSIDAGDEETVTEEYLINVRQNFGGNVEWEI